jgi:hypothetical protein
MISLQIDFSSDIDKGKLYDVLKTLKKTKYSISIKQHREVRSMSQNKYYWGVVIKIISNETGFYEDEVHEILKKKFNQKIKAMRQTGEEFLIGGSTTELDTLHFEEYLNKIKIWAIQELDIYIPDPNQY